MREERREQFSDRRRRRTSPLFNLHALRGRRRRLRRAADLASPHLALDWHAPQLLALTIGIMLLCLADAHNTLQLIRHGAEEMNIVMDYLIRRSTHWFVQVKLALTALGLVILVAYQHVAVFRNVRVRHLLYSILAFYVALVAYEVAIWPGPTVPLVFILT